MSLNLFDSLEEVVVTFYTTTLVALGVGFAVGGFMAGNLASSGRSRWIGPLIGLGYAGWVVGKYLGDKGSISPEMLTIGLVILAASSVGGLIGSAARGAPWLILGVIGAGVLIVLVMANGTSSVQSLLKTSVPTATPIRNKFGSTSVVPCVDMSKEVKGVADGFQATGTLKNLCDMPIDRVRLKWKIYDDGNQVINTVYGTPDSDVIFPGQYSTFMVKVKMPKQKIGYDLVVDQAEWAK